MKRLLLIAVSASLLGLSGAALANPPHHDGDGWLHSRWDQHDNRREHHDNGRWHHDRERWSHHDRDRYDRYHQRDRIVYVLPHDRDRRDVYLGLMLGPHGAFQYIQRW